MKFIISKSLLTAFAFTAAFQINAQQKTGINTSLMDKSVSPKDNFFSCID